MSKLVFRVKNAPDSLPSVNIVDGWIVLIHQTHISQA